MLSFTKGRKSRAFPPFFLHLLFSENRFLGFIPLPLFLLSPCRFMAVEDL